MLVGFHLCYPVHNLTKPPYLDDHFGTENTATEFEIEWYKLIKDILDEAIKQQPADKRQEGLVLL